MISQTVLKISNGNESVTDRLTDRQTDPNQCPPFLSEEAGDKNKLYASGYVCAKFHTFVRSVNALTLSD